MSSILVLLPSLRKKNREPHSQQEKVGAKRVKIALEELFLPTPHHPSFTSFFTFSFAPFSIWVRENLCYLMSSFFWEKKVLPFFGKIEFLHWFCHPQSHGKEANFCNLILSTVEKDVQNCSLEPQAGWSLSLLSLDFATEIFAFLSEKTPAAWISSSLHAPPTAGLWSRCYWGMTQRCFSCLWDGFLQTPPHYQESSEPVLFWSSRRFSIKAPARLSAFCSLDNLRQSRTTPSLQKLEILSSSLSLPHQKSLWNWPFGDLLMPRM